MQVKDIVARVLASESNSTPLNFKGGSSTVCGAHLHTRFHEPIPHTLRVDTEVLADLDR